MKDWETNYTAITIY